MVPNSLSHQKLLAKASTHGEKLTVTGGSHLTSDDMFKAMEVPVCEKEIKAMDNKQQRKEHEGLKDLLLQKLLTSTQYTAPQLTALMNWYQIFDIDKEAHLKPDKVEKWKEVMEN